jgi:hypothetical protein
MRQVVTLVFLFLGLTTLAQPFRTPTFTGVVTTDFLPTERNIPLGTGASYAMTWDANFLYVGVTGPGAYIKNEPTIMYIDSDPFISQSTGSINGFNYDNRSPELPFTGNLVLFFKTGYAEFRTSDVLSGTWSDRTEVTSQIITGTNDIEIKIPWVAFPQGTRPAALSFFFFKENGNPSQSDAFDVRPGITNVGETYGLDINLRPPELYYSLQTTNTNFYTGTNLFDWINFGASSVPPSNLSTTNITTTSARLSWQHVITRSQYEVRGRRRGTNQWISQRVPGTVNSIVVNNLLCNVPYEWHVRTITDTTQIVDIISAFSNIVSFRTNACSIVSPDGDVMVYPNPALKASIISIQSKLPLIGVRFAIRNLAGSTLQAGTLTGPQLKLSEGITGGLYQLELFMDEFVIRKTLQIVD